MKDAVVRATLEQFAPGPPVLLDELEARFEASRRRSVEFLVVLSTALVVGVAWAASATTIGFLLGVRPPGPDEALWARMLRWLPFGFCLLGGGAAHDAWLRREVRRFLATRQTRS